MAPKKQPIHTKFPFYTHDLRFWHDLKKGYVGSIVASSALLGENGVYTVLDALVFKKVKFLGLEDNGVRCEAIFEIVFDDYYVFDPEAQSYKPIDVGDKMKVGQKMAYPVNLVRPMFIKEWNKFEKNYGRK